MALGDYKNMAPEGTSAWTGAAGNASLVSVTYGTPAVSVTYDTLTPMGADGRLSTVSTAPVRDTPEAAVILAAQSIVDQDPQNATARLRALAALLMDTMVNAATAAGFERARPGGVIDTALRHEASVARNDMLKFRQEALAAADTADRLQKELAKVTKALDHSVNESRTSQEDQEQKLKDTDQRMSEVMDLVDARTAEIARLRRELEFKGNLFD